MEEHPEYRNPRGLERIEQHLLRITGRPWPCWSMTTGDAVRLVLLEYEEELARLRRLAGQKE